MTWAGAIALLALAVVIGSLVWLHVVPTGLSPIRNAVSQYGIGDFRVGYRIATIAFAVAGAALAVAVAVGDAVDRNAGAVVVLLCVFALARAAISWFPMDAPGAGRTSIGRAHWLLAIAAFGSITAAAFRLGHALQAPGRWHSLATASSALAWVMLVCLLSLPLSRSWPGVRARFGVLERGFYIAAIAWSALLAVAAVAWS